MQFKSLALYVFISIAYATQALLFANQIMNFLLFSSKFTQKRENTKMTLPFGNPLSFGVLTLISLSSHITAVREDILTF